MDLPENKTAKDNAGSAALHWVKRLQAIAQTGDFTHPPQAQGQ